MGNTIVESKSERELQSYLEHNFTKDENGLLKRILDDNPLFSLVIEIQIDENGLFHIRTNMYRMLNLICSGYMTFPKYPKGFPTYGVYRSVTFLREAINLATADAFEKYAKINYTV